jgi:hypothetical protein
MEKGGIFSTLFSPVSDVEDVSFHRQHWNISLLGPLQYKGDIIQQVHFPTVGHECVTRKYLGTLGSYDPYNGIISANKVSHILYGISEFPVGDECVHFTLESHTMFYSFLWGVNGIHFVDNKKRVAYYVIKGKDRTLINGVPGSGVVCNELEWFHYCPLQDDKDYLLNIDGVVLHLMGIRRIVLSATKQSNSGDLMRYRTFFDIDSCTPLNSTTQAVTTGHYKLHIEKDSVSVATFKKYTKMLRGSCECRNQFLYNMTEVAITDNLVDVRGVPFLARGKSKFKTSRNWFVFENMRRTKIMPINDMNFVKNIYFVGNNFCGKVRNNYFSPQNTDDKFYMRYYRIDAKSNVYKDFSIYETQCGSIVPIIENRSLQAFNPTRCIEGEGHPCIYVGDDVSRLPKTDVFDRGRQSDNNTMPNNTYGYKGQVNYFHSCVPARLISELRTKPYSQVLQEEIQRVHVGKSSFVEIELPFLSSIHVSSSDDEIKARSDFSSRDLGNPSSLDDVGKKEVLDVCSNYLNMSLEVFNENERLEAERVDNINNMLPYSHANHKKV